MQKKFLSIGTEVKYNQNGTHAGRVVSAMSDNGYYSMLDYTDSAAVILYNAGASNTSYIHHTQITEITKSI